MKNGTISSRASIVQRSKGQSAVEQSAYISRTSLYSDYYGMTYNRTAKEDLVGAGVLLPEHAPSEFEDRAVLWNSVEKNEKAKNAQLARSLKYSLPNEWDEATARQVMECFIKEQFVDKGMCGVDAAANWTSVADRLWMASKGAACEGCYGCRQ